MSTTTSTITTTGDGIPQATIDFVVDTARMLAELGIATSSISIRTSEYSAPRVSILLGCRHDTDALADALGIRQLGRPYGGDVAPGYARGRYTDPISVYGPVECTAWSRCGGKAHLQVVGS